MYVAVAQERSVVVFESGSHSQAQAGLELAAILLPPINPSAGIYRYEPGCPAGGFGWFVYLFVLWLMVGFWLFVGEWGCLLLLFLFVYFESRSCYVAQAELEFAVTYLPPECSGFQECVNTPR